MPDIRTVTAWAILLCAAGVMTLLALTAPEARTMQSWLHGYDLIDPPHSKINEASNHPRPCRPAPQNAPTHNVVTSASTEFNDLQHLFKCDETTCCYDGTVLIDRQSGRIVWQFDGTGRYIKSTERHEWYRLEEHWDNTRKLPPRPRSWEDEPFVIR